VGDEDAMLVLGPEEDGAEDDKDERGKEETLEEIDEANDGTAEGLEGENDE
jgi:hypothetical protein